MGFYEDLRDDIAAPLIREYGTAITLKSSVFGTFDPIASTAGTGSKNDYPGYGVITEYTAREIDGTNIRRGDKKITAVFDDTTVVPDTDALLTISGLDHVIKNVGVVAPADVAIIWILQVRQ